MSRFEWQPGDIVLLDERKDVPVFYKAAATPALVRIAERLVPSLKRRFLEAIRQIQDAISLDELARGIEDNSLNAVQIAAKIAQFPEQFGELAADIRAAFFAGSNYGIRDMAERAAVEMAFRVVNPDAVAYAESAVARIVRPFTEDAKALIADAVAAVIRGEDTPAGAARLIRDHIGLDPRRRDSLARFEDELREAGVEGDTLARRVAKERKRLLTQRALVIARHESMQAANAGQLASQRAAVREGLIQERDWVRTWHVTEDERLCPICAPLEGTQASINGAFPSGEPPLHVQCRCTITLHPRDR